MAEEKKFAILMPISVQRCAEGCGIENLSTEIAEALAEDASYRIREIVNISGQFMKRARRSRLKVQDVAKALNIANVPSALGEDHGNTPEYKYLEEEDFFFQIDDTISLQETAFSKQEESEVKPLSFVSEWLLLDGQPNSSVGSSEGSEIPTVLMEYFTNIVGCVLGEDKDLRRESLLDLRRNAKIAPLVPYFTNFALNVKAVSHDLEQLSHLLQTVSALVNNLYLNLMGYLKPLVSAVLYCVLEPLTASINPINDHWRLRDYGSRLLMHIVQNQGSTNYDVIEYIKDSVKNILLDPTRPLCSHYGSIVVINALGVRAIVELLCPNLLEYYQTSLKITEEESDANNLQLKEDAFKVLGAITHSIEKLCLHIIKGSRTDVGYLCKFCDEALSFFGDSSQIRLPLSTGRNDNANLPNDTSPNTGHVFRPAVIKLSVMPHCLKVTRRQDVFGPNRLRKRKIRISLGACTPPVDDTSVYTHSKYLILSVQTANIGKCRCLVQKRPRISHHDFLNLIL